MKKIVVVLSILSMLAAVVPVACSPNTASTAQKATGIVKSVDIPTTTGPGQITLQTTQGQQTFTITPNTTVSLDGYVCPIEDVGKVVSAGNATYNCTITYDPTYHAIAAGVYKQVQ